MKLTKAEKSRLLQAVRDVDESRHFYSCHAISHSPEQLDFKPLRIRYQEFYGKSGKLEWAERGLKLSLYDVGAEGRAWRQTLLLLFLEAHDSIDLDTIT